MLRRCLMGFATVMLLIAGVCGSVSAEMSTDAGVSPAVEYVDAILGAVDHIEENLPLIIEAAEQAADRLVAGGSLYAAGDEGGFVSEAYYRSGGMMMLLPSGQEWAENDVVLAGTLNLNPDEQREELRAMRAAGALVILFGSEQSPLKDEVDLLIGTGLSPGAVPAVTVEGWSEPICPVAPVGNIAALWTFEGELAAACTRRGQMPVMCLSIYMEGARERLTKYESYAFHEDMVIDPVPPGQVGGDFLAEMRRCLEGMRDHQIPAFQEGGQKIANVIYSGYTGWVVARGHHLQHYPFGLPGDPGILNSSMAATKGTLQLWQLVAAMGPKDALVYVGYYQNPTEDLQHLRDARFPSVLIIGGQETNPITPNPWETNVDPYWERGDACVEIPGYDIKILPPAGVIQTAALWMIIGEIAGSMPGTATITPRMVLAGQSTHIDITAVLSISPQEAEPIRRISLDLSPLGISSELLLSHVGERRYTGSTIITPSVTGRHTLPVTVTMETADGDEYRYLNVILDVYPDRDLSIYEDEPSAGWTVEFSNAESDLNSSAFVRSGSSSQAILLQPSIFPGRVEYIFEDPEGIESFGYSHLEFYINGGEASGQDPSVGGKKLSERGVVVASDTWTLVSLPISELSLVEGRLKSFRMSGAVKETFYIDDMKLVAEEPPTPEPTAVEASEGIALPSGYALSQNYPNPFNPETTICYGVANTGTVRLSLYALTGQRVRTLVDGERPAGSYFVTWDGTDDTGQGVASGVYLCRMEAGKFSAVRKLLLVR